MRVDKYLWAIRVFKTRSAASEACHKGHIRIGDDIVKASKEIKENDIINVSRQGVILSYKVLALLPTRVGAAKVPEFAMDVTTPEEKNKLSIRRAPSFEHRDRGAGRPTKRERREIDDFKYGE